MLHKETVDLTEGKKQARIELSREDPFRILLEALPDTMEKDEFDTLLRVLIRVARARGK